MCKPQTAGGQRCAAHTRPGYEATPISDPTWDDKAAAYASTRQGAKRLKAEADAAAHTGNYNMEARLRSALTRGETTRAANRETADRIRISKPAPSPFTDADRQPQDADQSFGISDHTTRVDPSTLIPFRDKDATVKPRDSARMDALRADIAEHGIGNPLALFHDGKRACLAEGNHRLGVAIEQGLVDVPLRIIRLRSLNEVSNFAKDSQPISAALRPHLR